MSTSVASASATDKPAPPAANLRVYNTLSRTKEPFQTLVPGKVGIYLCGPTVYAPSHIGHMVGPLIFDAIKRYLTWCGYRVTWVVNITDVDDKLIVRSNERGISMADLATEMTADYMANLRAMGIDTIDHFPKATENMAEIIQFTQELIDRGFAYPADGDVFFDVAKDAEYGKLSKRSLESLQGEGGGAAERKRSAADFALWKGAKPGEPSWPSPWGPGRPGWHIECSAMSRRLLGKSFDIHGGGLDLMFPHHENEIAQSECCHGQPQARYWMHNGLLQRPSETGKLGGRNTRAAEGDGDIQAQIDEKVSKSKGANAFSELLKRFPAETIRYFLLSTHYRRPIEFSDEQIADKQKALEQFYRFFARFGRIAGQSFYDVPPITDRARGDFDPGADATLGAVREYRQQFIEAMDDDFNSGGATGTLFELLRRLNNFCETEKLDEPAHRDAGKLAVLRQGATTLRELTATLGLFRAPVEQATAGGDELTGRLMALLIDLRAEARKTKNFALADRIRKSLAEIGVELEDRPDETGWSVKR
jgi:cysteinyl-tRNA synthetase